MPEEKLSFLPPEPQYIAEKEVFEIPLSDWRLKKPWELRLYASELVSKRMGDEAQVTSLKVKKPHLMRKTVAKLKRSEPQARLLVTIKF
ncbi:MAG TPA: hypothetical protein VFW52_03810 [Candidatus Saccharimonadales bacterium]|nr:hypothetical protein [Candidatus Saccharimonadales bacterium]